MNSKIYNLKPGDQLVEPLFQTVLTKHHAIYLGKDKNGNDWIDENIKFKNEQIKSSNQYFILKVRFKLIVLKDFKVTTLIGVRLCNGL
jgi:hypothetical protein